MFEIFIVDNGKPFDPKGKEIPHDRPILAMPSSLRDSSFFSDNCMRLAPEGKSWRCRNGTKRGQIGWVDPRLIKDKVPRDDEEVAPTERGKSGKRSNLGQDESCDCGKKPKRCV